MRKCPKCTRQYDDLVRICRTCGSFLEAVAESSVSEGEKPETSPDTDESPPVFTPMAEETGEGSEAIPDKDRPLRGERFWSCPQCHEPVPNTFEARWNCGTSRDGTVDPDFVKEPLDRPRDQAEEVPTTHGTAQRHSLQCPKCGSSKIIPRARVPIHPNADLSVVVYGNPDALIFKEQLLGPLRADICGDCGHVELRVENPESALRPLSPSGQVKTVPAAACLLSWSFRKLRPVAVMP